MDGSFSSGTAVSAPAPIDHGHLARYTLGNKALELEVLHLFSGQAPETFAALAAAADAKAWHIAAHTLKGSARAVGAWAVAHIAEEAERAGHASLQRGHLIDRLGEALGDVRGYIARLPAAA